MWGSIFLNCQVLNHPGGDLSRPIWSLLLRQRMKSPWRPLPKKSLGSRFAIR